MTNTVVPDASVPNPASKYVVSDDLYDGDEPFYDPVNPYTNGTDGSFCDPGYVSERSDEEDQAGDDRIPDGCESIQKTPFPEPPDGTEPTLDYTMKVCPFVNADTVFEVTVIKNSRGLGIALTGGIECDVHLAGLIRIRKVYPQTPAYLSGQLEPDDFILQANKNILTGLTSHEALEVLRTTGNEVNLLVCRPTREPLGGTVDSYAPTYDTTDSLAVPGANFNAHFLSPSPSFSTCGEMELHISKVNGSLGFTLRKQDNSILGHTIKSLVKEPALSDGRIRPGDKLLSVNGTDMCGLTHEQAVKFLRTCPQTVVLRLYRDAMQTPISPASPTEFEFMPRPKQLRKEARDMLSDLASRKQSGSLNLSENSETPGTTRRRRVQKTPSPDLKTNVNDKWESLVRDASTFPDDPPSYDKSYSPCEPRPNRPNFLDLKCHQSSSRKANFTPPHEEAPFTPLDTEAPHEMTSLDCVGGPSSAHSDVPSFSHTQPNYHSINLGALTNSHAFSSTTSDNDLKNCASDGQKKGLVKWKGVVFTPDEGHEESDRQKALQSLEAKTVTIELSRGWNSRLGFSLQQKNNRTVIVNIYEDSVAAKDGRLKVGDEIITVNGENVSEWPAEKTIDFLRKTTGKITLVTRQKYF